MTWLAWRSRPTPCAGGRGPGSPGSRVSRRSTSATPPGSTGGTRPVARSSETISSVATPPALSDAVWLSKGSTASRTMRAAPGLTHSWVAAPHAARARAAQPPARAPPPRGQRGGEIASADGSGLQADTRKEVDPHQEPDGGHVLAPDEAHALAEWASPGGGGAGAVGGPREGEGARGVREQPPHGHVQRHGGRPLVVEGAAQPERRAHGVPPA